MRTVRILVLMMVMTGLTGILGPVLSASAQEAVNSGNASNDDLQNLDQRVKILERRRDLDKEATDKAASETPKLKAGPDGFIILSPDESFKLKIGGYVQTDGRFWIGDKTKPVVNTLLLRRVRPQIDGTVARYFDFRIMPDFGGGTTVLYDAYLEIRTGGLVPDIRFGKFKPPLGLERLQSGTDLLFVERAFPTQLVPNRDIGVQLHGNVIGGVLDYALGLFNGTPDGGSLDLESTGSSDDKDIVARIFIQPLKESSVEALQGLGFGVAGSFGSQQGTPASPNLRTYSTPGQQTFFRYRSNAAPTVANTVIADGSVTRISPQAYYSWGPFGFLGEYVRSAGEVELNSVSTTANNTAWQVAVSYLLTSENATYKRVKPIHPFDPKAGTSGAWELAARYNELKLDSDLFPTYADPNASSKKAAAWAAGINWYLNANIKLTLDYEQTQFDGGGAAGTDREDEKIILSRAQVRF